MTGIHGEPAFEDSICARLAAHGLLHDFTDQTAS